MGKEVLGKIPASTSVWGSWTGVAAVERVGEGSAGAKIPVVLPGQNVKHSAYNTRTVL